MLEHRPPASENAGVVVDLAELGAGRVRRVVDRGVDKSGRLSVNERFGGDEDRIFFGVFDGHGHDGDLASYYAKEKIPKLLTKYMKASPALGAEGAKARPKAPAAQLDEMSRLVSKSFVDADKQMCKQSVFDTQMSGTTAVTVLVSGLDVIVANCGDRFAPNDAGNTSLPFKALWSTQFLHFEAKLSIRHDDASSPRHIQRKMDAYSSL